MTYYWILFGYFAIGSLLSGPQAARRGKAGILFIIGGVVMTLLVGMRYKVGGDWLNYEFIYDWAARLSFTQALKVGDPGFQAVNWIAYHIGADLWLVNLLCAAIFVWGLFRLCLTQPEPWLGALVAIPYMVIVIAMGYTRQAVALGFLMVGIADFLSRRSTPRFALYVIAAALFHKTAVIAFPVVALANDRNRLTNFLVVIAGGIALYDAFLGDSMDHFVQNYVHTRYSSQGAAIRIVMNTVAALSFWALERKMFFSEIERRVWRNFSIASLVSLFALLIAPSSTAIDRISLYIIPLQIAVLSRIPLVTQSRRGACTAIIFYCFAVQFVWLNFGQFSWAWIPYRFFPIFGVA